MFEGCSDKGPFSLFRHRFIKGSFVVTRTVEANGTPGSVHAMIGDLCLVSPSRNHPVWRDQCCGVINNLLVLRISSIQKTLELNHHETSFFINDRRDKIPVGGAVICLWHADISGIGINDSIRTASFKQCHVRSKHPTSLSYAKPHPTGSSDSHSQVNIFFVDLPVHSCTVLWMVWVGPWKEGYRRVAGFNFLIVYPIMV
mmetsp:Transcript_37154/g.107032  ORF Transcript_37154/g.107032 Transcript_37154/m.107032 type:complete len:200 (-) Transcript_37154:482-1081(-)